MRGLSKPWPPSDVSPDGQTPRRFVDAEREYRTTLPDRSDRTKFARTEFDRLDKGKLRKVMSGEQSSLCVYCERRLSENREPAHVEHWRPLSGAPEHALHWRNLVPRLRDDRHVRRRQGQPATQVGRRGSGSSVAHRARLRTAGRFRQRRPDVRPRRRAHRRGNPESPRAGHRRSSARRGSAAGDPQPESPDTRGGPRCGAGQRADAAESRLHATHRIKEERTARATQLLDQERRPAFVSIRVAWLRKRLGRGR